MNIFLKLKHWQLFMLLACTYLAFQISGNTTVTLSQGTVKKVSEHNYFGYKTTVTETTTALSSPEAEKKITEFSTVTPSQGTTVTVTNYSPLIMLFIIVLWGWFYTVCINLNKKLPDTVKMNLTKFKWIFFIPLTYLLLFWLFVYFVLFRIVSNGVEPNRGILAVIIPLHLFSMACLLYCTYFAAKSLKAVELQRPVTFSDYVGEFFLFVFFPIGVWFIQPKINRIFDETLQTKE